MGAYIQVEKRETSMTRKIKQEVIMRILCGGRILTSNGVPSSVLKWRHEGQGARQAKSEVKNVSDQGGTRPLSALFSHASSVARSVVTPWVFTSTT